jgi:molecular chaperone DnaK
VGKVIGIDLGTTNSCVAVMEGGAPEVVANSEGSRTTPSMVAFTESGETLVGQVAKRQALTHPERTMFAVKRLIGRKCDSEEVVCFSETSPFAIVPADNGDAWLLVGDRRYSPQEISSHVLSRLRDAASDFLGEPVEDAVITVPAYFDDAQRQATKDAGLLAGLNVLRMINEPTAAALAYGLGDETNQRIAVFDLGGGTFDISILELGEGVFEVRSTNGDTYLGGEDFDQRVIEHLLQEFKKESGIDLRADKMALQRLKEAAERAKQELSSSEETDINLPFIAADASGPRHLALTLTRDVFEALVADLVERVVEPCETAMADAGISKEEIDHVLLVGGMTRMPAIQRKVAEIFGKEPNRGVNPDEVVALGAAIQGGVLKGEVSDVLLLDVTPLSLGVETMGGVFTKIIEKNTTIPTRKSKIFSTTEDHQSVVSVHVLQGEREMAEDNKTLGRFELVGIPPAPRGVPQIELTFEIDSDGVAHVSAKDLGTSKSQAIRVTASSGLTEQELQKLLAEAEANKAADRSRRELADLRNQADGLIYSTERTLAEYGDKLQDADREALDEALQQTRDALAASDIEAIRAAVDELSALSYKMTEQLYASLGGE